MKKQYATPTVYPVTFDGCVVCDTIIFESGDGAGEDIFE